MIRTLAVTGVFFVAVGIGSPPVASAQTSGQGQAVGILYLLGASTGAHANAKTPGQKPKPSGSPEAQAKIVNPKPTPPTSKDRTGLVRVGGGPVEPTVGSNGKHN